MREEGAAWVGQEWGARGQYPGQVAALYFYALYLYPGGHLAKEALQEALAPRTEGDVRAGTGKYKATSAV